MLRKIFAAIPLILAACAPVATTSSVSAPVVLASTTFLADIARNVAGDRLQVESLLPLGADPHSYQVSPQDVARVADSDLLIVNGQGYEHFLETVLENAGGERTVLEASAGIKVREEAGAADGADPHLWLDPNNVVVYVANIRDGLSEIDPGGAEAFSSNAQAYTAQLQELDLWIRDQVNTIPVERRLLVTNHESLGYFAGRYGFTVVGTVVPGFSSEAAPSAKQMAALIDQIKTTGAPAVFLDAADATTLAEQIASDTGVTVVTDLHLESLTDGSPADTYIQMMKSNVSRIVEALR